MTEQYQPEKYWTEVGKRIKERDQGENVIAGDDEPYYRYKRERFLELLKTVEVSNKSILEIGCGPGGNLVELLQTNAKSLAGVDISQQMVELAKQKLPSKVEITKVNGTVLPFEDNTFDIVFSATVLQHNTDDTMMRSLMGEMSRVSKSKVIIFERIEQEIKGDDLCLGRPISYYSAIMKENGYELLTKEHINIRASYYISGGIRKLLNPKTRQEGEPLNSLSVFAQNITLPITKLLDKVFTSGNDVTKLEFVKK